MRLIGSDSGSTRRTGNVNGLRCQWFATIGGLGRQRLRVLVPRPVGWGGGAPGCWQYDRRREAAAGAAALVSRQWTPPNVADNNNNMTIRRIYNKLMLPHILPPPILSRPYSPTYLLRYTVRIYYTRYYGLRWLSRHEEDTLWEPPRFAHPAPITSLTKN